MAYTIHAAMSILRDKLVTHLLGNINEMTLILDVHLSNIAFMDTAGTSQEVNTPTGIIISLVNIEEESTLKNGKNFRKNPATGRVDYENPPVYLNLYILFSVNVNSYDLALQSLSTIIQAFQGEYFFRRTIDGEQIEISLDLYTMTFEQINHLWGSLGGKQVPFVMYKARVVSITDRRSTGSGRVIESIEGNTHLKVNP